MKRLPPKVLAQVVTAAAAIITGCLVAWFALRRETIVAQRARRQQRFDDLNKLFVEMLASIDRIGLAVNRCETTAVEIEPTLHARIVLACDQELFQTFLNTLAKFQDWGRMAIDNQVSGQVKRNIPDSIPVEQAEAYRAASIGYDVLVNRVKKQLADAEAKIG